MIAIRFHGRGGQGAVIASKLLANAFFREGWEVQAFPAFGAERSGAPVTAFLRADRHPITLHCQIYEPDVVVVLDPLLLTAVDVTAGLRPEGALLVNSGLNPADLPVRADARLATCDATAIAIEHGLGTRTHPIVNTAMAGAFAAFTRLVSLDAVLDAMAGVVPLNIEANRAAAGSAFERTVQREVGVLAGSH
jgi:pyruvate ferredoxin oxidoreductase gamma subunit/2-oxoisovalerate ferredoxin oxidoreductase gamma subunit